MEKSYQKIRTGYVNALADYYLSWVEFITELNDEDFKLSEIENL